MKSMNSNWYLVSYLQRTPISHPSSSASGITPGHISAKVFPGPWSKLASNSSSACRRPFLFIRKVPTWLYVRVCVCVCAVNVTERKSKRLPLAVLLQCKCHTWRPISQSIRSAMMHHPIFSPRERIPQSALHSSLHLFSIFKLYLFCPTTTPGS